MHGLTTEFLTDKPLFGDVADELLAFLGEAPLAAHNAGFDIAFLNAELGKEKAAAGARLEDLPSQSCRRYRINRPVCRPHDFVSAVVCASGPAAFAAGAVVVGRDGTSKCRMDCPAINRDQRQE